MEEIRTVLAKHGFFFKKKFGQNFLTDSNLLDAIVRDAGVDASTTVLEIGAGAGALTRALSRAAKKVLAYEIDASLRPVLAETLAGCENAEVAFGDFLRADLPALERELGSYRVVANLPYYVTTPVMMRFLEEATSCTGLTVMVQEEVALRFTAQPGTAEYGAVTAAIALRGEARIMRKVPRTMFTPRPNVDSAIVRVDFCPGRIPRAERGGLSRRRAVRLCGAQKDAGKQPHERVRPFPSAGEGDARRSGNSGHGPRRDALSRSVRPPCRRPSRKGRHPIKSVMRRLSRAGKPPHGL